MKFCPTFHCSTYLLPHMLPLFKNRRGQRSRVAASVRDERVLGPGGGLRPGRAGGRLGRQRLIGAPGRAGELGQGGGLPQGDAGAAPVRLQQRCGADPAAARRPRPRGLQRAGRPPAPARH